MKTRRAPATSRCGSRRLTDRPPNSPAESRNPMRLANLAGRATVVVDGRAVDVEQASDGRLSSDPMILSDLAQHDALRAIVADATPADWPLIDMMKLMAPVP